ncbi:VOC family protein [Fictibacillus norfolkensis]|uniref:VOC family protein n=1 Tax=Fictibacillus norfolkensis TaxID=2762233 RepID=A0ABR8SR96_9BACL|nr:VOC family protein [Fictibacillus norfolkensis]MBD7965981.1 VOC family protein [Fictibacillus norfolkensis]
MTSPQGLHHIEMNVQNLRKTKEFYEWLLPELGYSLFQEWEKGFSYKMESSYLVFVQTDELYNDIPFHRKRSGLNHLAFWAKSRAQIEHLRVQLKKKNISFLYEDKFPFAGGKNHYALFFEDPDRLKIEIVAPR